MLVIDMSIRKSAGCTGYFFYIIHSVNYYILNLW